MQQLWAHHVPRLSRLQRHLLRYPNLAPIDLTRILTLITNVIEAKD